jgi:hypothetical protein
MIWGFMTLIELFRNAWHRCERTSVSYQFEITPSHCDDAWLSIQIGQSFPHFTLGAGRGPTDGLAEPQSALWSRWEKLASNAILYALVSESGHVRYANALQTSVWTAKR